MAEAKKKKAGASEAEMPRMKKLYFDEIVPGMLSELGYKNRMQVPRLDKIVVNMGVGEAALDNKQLDGALADLAIITGQKAIVRKAKKSIASFKIRAGMPVGAKVTLRGNRMYEFLDRLISAALPRIRDFRGLNPSSFDGRGNYTFGVTEQLIFPEIDYDKIDRIRGMDITIVINGADDSASRDLLKRFGFPFRQ